MYYVDSQRTLTRRDSSLVTTRGLSEGYDTGRTRSTTRFASESNSSFLLRPPPRPNGSVKKELVTMMFDSMLGSIVESWDVILPPAISEELSVVKELPKTLSEQTFTSKKTKKGGRDTGPPPTGQMLEYKVYI